MSGVYDIDTYRRYQAIAYECRATFDQVVEHYQGRPRQPRRCIHFVGFRGDEFWSAVRIWGRPDFIHRRWDQRARREIAPGDTIIFATGSEADLPTRWNGSDIVEPAV